MALQKNIIYKGIQIKDAYFKITNIQGNKEEIFYGLSVFVNKELSDNINNQIVTYNHVFVPENELRWDKLCYEHAKTLDEYKDAIDC